MGQRRRVDGSKAVSEPPQPDSNAIARWREAGAAVGSPVEAYLRSRGIRIPPPAALRFNRLKHPSGTRWPAMVALVTQGDTGLPLAIHRTF